MGFLDGLFGSSPKYPPLDKSNPAAVVLSGYEQQILALTGQTKDPLEVVPAKGRAYIFVGKPPKQFGLAWVDGTGVHYLKNYAKEHNFDAKKSIMLMESIGAVYSKYSTAPRFSHQVGGRVIVVTPSESLAGDVEQVLA